MSTEPDKRIIAVFGATGYQGGSVVKHFHNNPATPNLVMRALTRDPTSAKAVALSNTGVAVAQANLSDPSTLKTALEGVHGVYLLTDFFATFFTTLSAEAETQQGINAFNVIASIPTIEHVIWSSAPSITHVSGGKYTNVVHMESKAKVTQYVKEKLPEVWKKTTELYIGAYYQLWVQFPQFFAPKKVEDGGAWVMSAPCGEGLILPGVDVRDTGATVHGIFLKRTELGGKTVSLVGDDTTGTGDRLKTWGKLLGQKTAWNKISDEVLVGNLSALGIPEMLVTDMADTNFAFRDFEGKILHGEGIVQAKDILPDGKKLTTWEEYVKTENWDSLIQSG
ncbi:hypothetical protein BDV95DRAFT_382814 [Massariosphaeria phaeospora]|uniref:NmrA-like domain-containing protein n=1 Tax=Massariosphaeria phaeospora TaxID=100035 RepID=A0A7C8IBW8_9PLEO|nr:hypothetical protein BDV95DRAFT_382814 [Massariosphaeria phaeospora]